MQNGSNSFLIRLLITALAVLLTSYLLPGVHVANFFWAVLVALVLAFMNVTVKPFLIILTIPVTVVTLGLFLLVINAVVILLVGYFIPGFDVDGFWWAIGFSLVLSIVNSVLNSIIK